MKEIDIHSEHPKYSRETWETEAFVSDTQLGYWQWVAQQMEADGSTRARIKSQVHQSGLPPEINIDVRKGVAYIGACIGQAVVNITDHGDHEAEGIHVLAS